MDTMTLNIVSQDGTIRTIEVKPGDDIVLLPGETILPHDSDDLPGELIAQEDPLTFKLAPLAPQVTNDVTITQIINIDNDSAQLEFTPITSDIVLNELEPIGSMSQSVIATEGFDFESKEDDFSIPDHNFFSSIEDSSPLVFEKFVTTHDFELFSEQPLAPIATTFEHNEQKIFSTNEKEIIIQQPQNTAAAYENQAPELASAIANQSSTEDSTFTFQVSDSAFTDIEDITYSASLADDSALPSWLSFDASTRTFSGTPTNDNLGTVSVKITADDGLGESTSDTFDLTTTGVNDAPILDNSSSPTLTTIAEDVANGSNGGTTVATFVGSSISDVDAGAVEGIAVISVDDTNGTWQFSTDSGSNWTAFSASTPSASAATLLNSTALIRFTPDANYTGSGGNIGYRAWDLSTGSNGQTAIDVSTNGDATAYSSTSETASITVSAVDDAPINTVPGGVIAGINSAKSITGISISEIDGDTLTVTLTVSNGTLNVANNVGSGLDAGDISNNGTASVTITGTLSEINTTLADANGLQYTGSATYFGQDSLSIATNDGTTTDTDSINISVNGTGSIELANLNGANGTVINGAAENDDAGTSVTAIGDMNGDGYEDFAIGASMYDNSSTEGAAYVVFGNSDGFSSSVDLTALDGSDGFLVYGASGGDDFGAAIAGGDINGDGYDDLVIGAFDGDNGATDDGEVFVVWGKSSAYSASYDAGSLTAASTGIKIEGDGTTTDAGLGQSIGVADVNGDGVDDLILGAPSRYTAANPAGDTYIVYGKTTGWTDTMEITDLDGTDGHKLTGEGLDDSFGFTVSGIGDINGDGFEDILVGADAAGSDDDNADDSDNGREGQTFVIFGGSNLNASLGANFNVSDLDGADGFQIDGVAAGDNLGTAVSGLGDINGDGLDDFIVAAHDHHSGTDDEGRSYVVFGKTTAWAADMELTDLDGSDGFSISGIDTDDQSGEALGMAGDFNGDGYNDILVGSYFADPNGSESGEAYILFGGNSFSANFDLSSLDGTDGMILNGSAASEHAGISVSGAGDINGDGFDDLLIGANEEDSSGAGQTYVVYGYDVGAETDYMGTSGNDTLTGSSADDILNGGQGNDTLTLNGNVSGVALLGGAGDDTLVFDNVTTINNALRIDGGTGGNDTLSLDGTGATLDLTATDNTIITGIERIDLNTSSANTLTLTIEDVFEMSEDLNSTSSTANTLYIDGDSDDTVNSSETWAAGASSGGYTAFTNGNATLYIDADISTGGLID